MIPQHKIKEENGSREYTRLEDGGNTRVLRVWSMNSCRTKMKHYAERGELEHYFGKMAAQLGEYAGGPDPMFAEWFTDCFNNMETAYNELKGTPSPFDTLEDFSSDALEDFAL